MSLDLTLSKYILYFTHEQKNNEDNLELLSIGFVPLSM